jgi:hypothetical protein
MNTTIERLQERSATSRSKSPVFVVGSPRSGTSLLYHSLMSSGGFAVYDQETHFFSGLATRVGNLAHLKNRKELIEKWRESQYFKVSGLEMKEVERRILSDCRNSGDFLRIVMESMAQSQNVDRWAEKTPDHVLYLGEIKRTVPDALIIHIIRDGRDVALSLDGKGDLHPYLLHKSHALLACGLYWEWLVETGSRMAPKLGSHYLEVRFENLVNKPRETLAQIGQFIDYDLDYDRIQQVGMRTVGEPNTSFREKDNSAGFNPVNRWKKAFPAGELARFEALVGPCLQKRGYELASGRESVNRRQLHRLRAYYRFYFSLRLWTKTHHVPMAKYFVKDRC